MIDLNKIVNELVVSGFHELSDMIYYDKINAEFSRLNCCLFEYERISGKYIVRADNQFKKVSDSIIKGGIAHELAHIEYDALLTPHAREKSKDLYVFKEYRTHIERDTDLRAVQRGFGKELLSLLVYKRKKGIDYQEDSGLFEDELRQLLNGKLLK